MKVEFVDFNMAGPKGQLTKISVNPIQVCAILPIVIPGAINGPGGEKIGKAAAALDFGGNAIPVDCSVKEAIAKLEQATNEGNPPLDLYKH